LKGIKMILAVTPEQYRDFQLDEIKGLCKIVDLKAFKPKDFLPLVREFLCYNGFDNENFMKIKDVIDAYSVVINGVGYWYPKMMRDLIRTFESIKN